MPETPSPRRGRRRSAPPIAPHARAKELVEIIAKGLARLASGTSNPPEESAGEGLELPEHAALSVPAGEHPAANAPKAGERHDR